MKLHPGDVIRWQGGTHQIIAVRPSYLTLRSADGEEDIEVLTSDLQGDAEPAAAIPARHLLELRHLDELDAADTACSRRLAR